MCWEKPGVTQHEDTMSTCGGLGARRVQKGTWRMMMMVMMMILPVFGYGYGPLNLNRIQLFGISFAWTPTCCQPRWKVDEGFSHGLLPKLANLPLWPTAVQISKEANPRTWKKKGSSREVAVLTALAALVTLVLAHAQKTALVDSVTRADLRTYPLAAFSQSGNQLFGNHLELRLRSEAQKVTSFQRHWTCFADPRKKFVKPGKAALTNTEGDQI